MNFEEALSTAKVIRLQPDDLFVMRFPGVEVDEEFTRRLRSITGERRILVLADDVKFGVVEWQDLPALDPATPA